jgi:hypothetical protein
MRSGEEPPSDTDDDLIPHVRTRSVHALHRSGAPTQQRHFDERPDADRSTLKRPEVAARELADTVAAVLSRRTPASEAIVHETIGW